MHHIPPDDLWVDESDSFPGKFNYYRGRRTGDGLVFMIHVATLSGSLVRSYNVYVDDERKCIMRAGFDDYDSA